MSKFRGLVTSGTGFTFLVVGVTGVIFQFWFKTRPLLAIHAWLGVAMFVVAVVHIFQNWRSFLRHLRDWRVYAVLVPLLGGLAYYSLHTHGEGRRGFAGRGGFQGPEGRREGDRGGWRNGNNGGGNNASALAAKLATAHADGLASAFGKDADTVLASMKKDGLKVDGGAETVQDLARQNRKSPEEVLMYFVR